MTDTIDLSSLLQHFLETNKFELSTGELQAVMNNVELNYPCEDYVEVADPDRDSLMAINSSSVPLEFPCCIGISRHKKHLILASDVGLVSVVSLDTHKPVLQVELPQGSARPTALSLWDDPMVLVVGTSDGRLHVFKHKREGISLKLTFKLFISTKLFDHPIVSLRPLLEPHTFLAATTGAEVIRVSLGRTKLDKRVVFPVPGSRLLEPKDSPPVRLTNLDLLLVPFHSHVDTTSPVMPWRRKSGNFSILLALGLNTGTHVLLLPPDLPDQPPAVPLVHLPPPQAHRERDQANWVSWLDVTPTRRKGRIEQRAEIACLRGTRLEVHTVTHSTDRSAFAEPRGSGMDLSEECLGVRWLPADGDTRRVVCFDVDGKCLIIDTNSDNPADSEQITLQKLELPRTLMLFTPPPSESPPPLAASLNSCLCWHRDTLFLIGPDPAGVSVMRMCSHTLKERAQSFSSSNRHGCALELFARLGKSELLKEGMVAALRSTTYGGVFFKCISEEQMPSAAVTRVRRSLLLVLVAGMRVLGLADSLEVVKEELSSMRWDVHRSAMTDALRFVLCRVLLAVSDPVPIKDLMALVKYAKEGPQPHMLFINGMDTSQVIQRMDHVQVCLIGAVQLGPVALHNIFSQFVAAAGEVESLYHSMAVTLADKTEELIASSDTPVEFLHELADFWGSAILYQFSIRRRVAEEGSIRPGLASHLAWVFYYRFATGASPNLPRWVSIVGERVESAFLALCSKDSALIISRTVQEPCPDGQQPIPRPEEALPACMQVLARCVLQPTSLSVNTFQLLQRMAGVMIEALIEQEEPYDDDEEEVGIDTSSSSLKMRRRIYDAFPLSVEQWLLTILVTLLPAEMQAAGEHPSEGVWEHICRSASVTTPDSHPESAAPAMGLPGVCMLMAGGDADDDTVAVERMALRLIPRFPPFLSAAWLSGKMESIAHDHVDDDADEHYAMPYPMFAVALRSLQNDHVGAVRLLSTLSSGDVFAYLPSLEAYLLRQWKRQASMPTATADRDARRVHATDVSGRSSSTLGRDVTICMQVVDIIRELIDSLIEKDPIATTNSLLQFGRFFPANILQYLLESGERKTPREKEAISDVSVLYMKAFLLPDHSDPQLHAEDHIDTIMHCVQQFNPMVKQHMHALSFFLDRKACKPMGSMPHATMLKSLTLLLANITTEQGRLLVERHGKYLPASLAADLADQCGSVHLSVLLLEAAGDLEESNRRYLDHFSKCVLDTSSSICPKEDFLAFVDSMSGFMARHFGVSSDPPTDPVDRHAVTHHLTDRWKHVLSQTILIEEATLRAAVLEEFVSAMAGVIPPDLTVTAVLDSLEGGETSVPVTWGEARKLLRSVSDQISFTLSMYDALNRTVESEQRLSFDIALRTRKEGRQLPDRCDQCGRSPHSPPSALSAGGVAEEEELENQGSVVRLKCGHLLHWECLPETPETTKNREQLLKWQEKRSGSVKLVVHRVMVCPICEYDK